MTRAYLFSWLLLLPVSLFGTPPGNAVSAIQTEKYTFLVPNQHPFVPKFQKNILAYAPNQRFSAITRLLDSLGYFFVRFDTIKGDTIRLSTGPRTTISKIEFVTSVPVAIDSLLWRPYPRPYDAYEISVLSNQVLRFCGDHGYPFAEFSLMIISDSTEKCTLRYTIYSGRMSLNAEPRILGTIKTAPSLIRKDIRIRAKTPYTITAVEQAEARLAARSYIASVKALAPYPISNRLLFSADTDTVRTDFVIFDRSAIDFAGALTLASGTGESSRLVGTIEIGLLNGFHYGEEVSVAYRGEKNITLLSISLGVPYLFNSPLFCSGRFGLELKQNDYGFIDGELGASIEWVRDWRIGASANGHEASTVIASGTDTTVSVVQYGGIDLFIEKPRAAQRGPVAVHDLLVRTGTGIANADGLLRQRWNVALDMGAQFPTFRQQAIMVRLVSKNLFSDEESLSVAEQYHVGGAKSIRGYFEGEYSFRHVLYGQIESGYFLGLATSLYLFCDAGSGIAGQVSTAFPKRTDMLGYGLGIRVPVRSTLFFLEWARNMNESRSLGRLHFGFNGTLGDGGKKP